MRFLSKVSPPQPSNLVWFFLIPIYLNQFALHSAIYSQRIASHLKGPRRLVVILFFFLYRIFDLISETYLRPNYNQRLHIWYGWHCSCSCLPVCQFSTAFILQLYWRWEWHPSTIHFIPTASLLSIQFVRI